MAVATDAWTPDPDAVAALLAQRTGDPTGQARRTWTSTTVPTIAQVQEIIRGIVAEVYGFVGTVSADLFDSAKRVVVLGAASYVELQFYPDQNTGTLGPAEQLYNRYQMALKQLKDAVQGGAGGAGDATPEYSFPSNDDIPTPWPRITTMGERF